MHGSQLIDNTRPVPGWRPVNISPAERIGRIVAGVAAIIAGAVLRAAARSVLAVVPGSLRGSR